MPVLGSDLILVERTGVRYKTTAQEVAALAIGVGGPPVVTTVEVDLGAVPRYSGVFTIAGVGLAIGKPVYVHQAHGPYTGKGTLADEVEMDLILVSGRTTSATVITCYWVSQFKAGGNVKFDYMVGA